MNTVVCEIDKCCGCNACVNICPKKCISIVDNIKSLNAIINKDICINCKICEKVCQVNNITSKLIKFNKVEKCYEGLTRINDINELASSGGFATTLGYEFAKNGGFVVGIKSVKETFYFDLTNNPEKIKLFAGSKYVKVSTKNIYIKIKEKLINNEMVLFFGVPCQVAGLKLFLQKEYSKLYTVDLICHGTPSEKVLLKYLKEKQIDNTMNISFRKKHQYQLFKDNQPILTRTICDPYTIGFLNGLFYTENCYSCRYATSERISDITIGDSWGSSNRCNDGLKSLSLILLNSKKGEYLLSLLSDTFIFTERAYEDAIKYNNQLSHPSSKQPYTNFYFKHFENMTTFKIIKKAYPKIILKQKIKYYLVKLHLK